MKQIIGHRITIAFTAFALALSIYWYVTSWEIEPLICTISSLGLLITGIFFTANPAENTPEEKQPQPTSEEAAAGAEKKYTFNNQDAKIGQINVDSEVTNKDTKFFPKK